MRIINEGRGGGMMPSTDRREKTERSARLRIKAQEILTLLATEFGISVPHLKWHGLQQNGRACPAGNYIRSGPNVWRGIENSILHEFAHILDYRRNATASSHGTTFWAALSDTCRAWYGDGEEYRYGWSTEYSVGMAYGRRKGWLPR